MKTTTALLTTIVGLASAIPIGNTTVPETISLWHNKGEGLIEYNVNTGLISRGQAPAVPEDVSTLMTFNFPSSTSGLKCEFRFELNDVGHFTIQDTPTFDVFTSSQIATKSGTGSNYRDNQLGRMKAASPQASTEWGTFTFPCPAGQRKGFEVVPTGEKSKISWANGYDGPFVVWSA